MMKKILGFLVLVLLFSGIVYSADDSDSSNTKFRLDYNISVYDPLNRPVTDDIFCIGTTLYVNVTNHNTHKPLSNVEVTAYVNGTTAMVNKYTDYNGIAFVPITEVGVYRLRILRTMYKTELSAKFYNFTSCTSTTSTTTTTITTTTSEITTTTTLVSTTLPGDSTTSTVPVEASTTTTILSESCSDGLKNQDETGVDCGGSCGPCSPIDLTGILIAVFVIAVFGVIVFFLVSGGKKEKGAAKELKGHNDNKKHVTHMEAKK